MLTQDSDVCPIRLLKLILCISYAIFDGTHIVTSGLVGQLIQSQYTDTVTGIHDILWDVSNPCAMDVLLPRQKGV